MQISDSDDAARMDGEGGHSCLPSRPDALINRERIRGANRMIPPGTEAAAVTKEQIELTARDVETFIAAHKISRAMVARAVGLSAATISQFLAMKYEGDVGGVAIELDNWLTEEEARRSRPATTQFVWTNVAMKIKSVASYCLDFKKIGLIYGPDTSGIGKTTALRAIAQELGPRKCTLVTINKVDSTKGAMLKRLCLAIGVDAGGSNDQRFDRLVEKLKDRSHLLILDQAHNLRFANRDEPFYRLTDLYDATGSAQLWCGTANIVAYLQRQQGRHADESLAQVCRRIFPCVDLMEGLSTGNGTTGGGNAGEPLVTIAQVREMFAKNKLKLADPAARFICKLCNQPNGGSVGLCVQIVEYATMLAEMRRQTVIDLALLQEALRAGLSPQRSTMLLAKMDVEAAPMRAAKTA
jgi:DNA transposition AAA+ family ATPase